MVLFHLHHFDIHRSNFKIMMYYFLCWWAFLLWFVLWEKHSRC